MIYVLLADGFEEIEAVAVIDILRRADLEVLTVGIGGKQICGSHGIVITADIDEKDMDAKHCEAVILPGGVPGTPNLESSEAVQALIDEAVKCGAWICAICAAPSILGKKGLLKGKGAACYPGWEKYLDGAVIEKGVAVDKPFITASGAGVAVGFALEIAARLKSPEEAERIRSAMQCG